MASAVQRKRAWSVVSVYLSGTTGFGLFEIFSWEQSGCVADAGEKKTVFLQKNGLKWLHLVAGNDINLNKYFRNYIRKVTVWQNSNVDCASCSGGSFAEGSLTTTATKSVRKSQP